MSLDRLTLGGGARLKPEFDKAAYEARFGPIAASPGYQRATEAAVGGFLRETNIEHAYAQAYLGGASHEEAMRVARQAFQPGVARKGVGPFGPENKASIEAYLQQQGVLDPRGAAGAGAPVRSGAPRPRKDTILRQLRALAGESGPDLPPPPPEPARFRAPPKETRLAGELFRGASLEEAIGRPSAKGGSWRYQRILESLPGGGGGAPPGGPPLGPGPAQGPLPSGRPRTGVTMAGSRLPGILGLGLASLGGIAGAVVQDENHLTPEVATSLGLGLGGAGLLAAAALRAPADNYLIRRGR